MAKAADLTGQTFSNLTVLRYSRRGAGAKRYWLCLCKCGSHHEAETFKLRSGEIKSCGCLRSERIGSLRRSHAKSSTAEFKTWLGIKRRCFNEKDKSFQNYGGAGITMNEVWASDFEAFLDHVGKKPTPKHTIDRIDPTRGYEPGNVRWATMLEQQNNRSNNRRITLNGKTQTVAEWGRETGLGFAIVTRLARGWSEERALTVPLRKWPQQKGV